MADGRVQSNFSAEWLDPAGPLDLSETDTQKYLAGRFVNLVEVSIGEAVKHAEIDLRHGKAEVGPVKLVDPDDVMK